MVKVYLPSFAICTLSLTVNLLILGISPLRAIAQDSASNTNDKQAADVASIEPEILSEINRVRTNPQGYARWLEDQKQYYDHIWLKLPGEKPIRAHRLQRAINEAIAVLKEQKPLPALDVSEQTTATATKKLDNFATANDIQNISYGRVTPQGIVMSLVVDELFPDRRRRTSLLSPDANDTGVVCKNDPRYAKICAIAYSNSAVDDIAQEQPEADTETETTSSQSEVVAPPTPPEAETAANKPNIPEDTENSEVTTEIEPETLPQPPQPQIPPAPTADPEVKEPPVESAEEIAQADLDEEIEEDNDDEEPEAELEDVEPESMEKIDEAAENDDESSAESDEEADIEEIEAEIDDIESENEDLEEKIDDVEEEVFEAESESTESEIATNSDVSTLLENVERGALEEGDRIIAEDGSFYDSYPIDVKSGESFTISLESDEFDAFVALIDAKGNIIEQNDDVSEEDSNSRIRVTIPENGVYNIIVNAYDEGGGGQYVLTVSR